MVAAKAAPHGPDGARRRHRALESADGEDASPSTGKKGESGLSCWKPAHRLALDVSLVIVGPDGKEVAPTTIC